MQQSLHKFFNDLRLSQPPTRPALAGTDYLLIWTEIVGGPDGFGTMFQAPMSTVGLLGAVNLAAAGVDQGSATVLTFARSYVTSGSGGVQLPQARTFGSTVLPVFNRTGVTINTYPFLGDQIEGNGVNTAVTLANNQTAYFSVDATGIVRLA